MRKINEIFYSLQGEGFHTGTPAVFVRFSGCNLACDFCDPLLQSGKDMTDEEIVNEVTKYPSRHLILTGGEPSLFIDRNFVQLFKNHGFYVQIETNGTRPLPDNIDWVTFSPKKDWVLTHADELKIVFQTGVDLEDWNQFDTSHRYLQPCSMHNVKETVNYILAHPQWHLSLQTHKMIDIQ